MDTATLSDTVPLIFQWLPKNFGSTLPNNEDYLYAQRLVDWAIREPQREVYLVVNGAGFEEGQMKELAQQFSPIENIHVVDFSKIDLRTGITLSLDDGDVEVKLSEMLKHMYTDLHAGADLHIDQNMGYMIEVLPFGVMLDAMRLSMLQNLEQITNTNEAIYMDFDILPDVGGDAQIGEVKIPFGILMADGRQNTKDIASVLENSIIAVNDSSQQILEEMVRKVRESIDRKVSDMMFVKLDPGVVYGEMVKVIDDRVLPQAFNMTEEQFRDYKHQRIGDRMAKRHEYKSEIAEQYELYNFQSSGGRVALTQDNSWKKTIPLDFSALNIRIRAVLREGAKLGRHVAPKSYVPTSPPGNKKSGGKQR